jgi:hypothetical protein
MVDAWDHEHSRRFSFREGLSTSAACSHANGSEGNCEEHKDSPMDRTYTVRLFCTDYNPWVSEKWTILGTKITDFWDTAPCILTENCRRFRGANCQHLTLVMGAVSTSETSVYFYRTTQRMLICHLHICHRENLILTILKACWRSQCATRERVRADWMEIRFHTKCVLI